MAEFQAYTCDTVGNVYDRIPFVAASYSTLLSAGDSGSSITIPLDGTFTKTEMRNHFRHWSRIIAIECDGVIEYMGYITDRGYARGRSMLELKLADAWTLFGRRGAWDHNAPNMEKWSTTVTGNLAYQAAQAILRGRSGPSLPTADLPVTLPGGYAGPSVTRKYFGYHGEMVRDVVSDLMAEGLDILLRPRWASNSQVDWLYQAGKAWGSGVTHEFYVTADASEVVAFSESSDASRVTNNSRRIGEGSEVDMLVRSERNQASLYPLLDRVEMSKNISDVAQLSALSAQDLVMYGDPTFQWQFTVAGDHPVAVGDTVRMHFDGDPWIADGWHPRRVVKVARSVPGPHVKTISVQPTGGA